MTTNIVLNLRSLTWGFGESCLIVHCTIRHFCRPPTGRLKFENGTFQASQFGLRRREDRGNVHSLLRPCVPIRSPLTRMMHPLHFLCYLPRSEKAFPPVRPRYDDNYGPGSCIFVERQKRSLWSFATLRWTGTMNQTVADVVDNLGYW